MTNSAKEFRAKEFRAKELRAKYLRAKELRAKYLRAKNLRIALLLFIPSGASTKVKIAQPSCDRAKRINF
jgi:hypothetical protein